MKVRLERYDGAGPCREEIERIYLCSFPTEERRPEGEWWTLIGSRKCPLELMRIVGPDDVTVGFISFWEFPGFVYLEHFAVDSRYRCGGTGSAALKTFLDQTDLPVVLEVERPGANDMADRRIGFYSRMGFRPEKDFDYVQPPYAPGLPSVPLMLMTSRRGSVSLDDIAATLHREVYGAGR